MPRTARLDVLGVVQHVMARGLDGQEIFRDGRDRKEFLDRLGRVVEEGGAQLLAWALMGNHYHLVLRPRRAYLKDLMRRLMTGYAVWFNRRHDRKGHLFQNRYRSIVVEEEPYLLELIRYVHLNPVRAGAVGGLDALDRYSYTGHAVLMGTLEYGAQDTDEVLGRFGERQEEARARYRRFVQAGLGEGVRKEFRGGGLVRSAGGWAELKRRKPEERELADERILGSGAFVEAVLEKEDAREERRPVRDVDQVLSEVATEYGVRVEEIKGLSRDRKVSAARRAFYRKAYRETAATMAELARRTGRSQPAVWQAVRQAKEGTDV